MSRVSELRAVAKTKNDEELINYVKELTDIADKYKGFKNFDYIFNTIMHEDSTESVDNAIKMELQEALVRHQRKWKWIADTTREKCRPVVSMEYFTRMETDEYDVDVFLNHAGDHFCKFVEDNLKIENHFERCQHCPLQWKDKSGNPVCTCYDEDSLVSEWLEERDVAKSAELAERIANLELKPQWMNK